jgi:hypothetical protein
MMGMGSNEYQEMIGNMNGFGKRCRDSRNVNGNGSMFLILRRLEIIAGFEGTVHLEKQGRVA